MAAHSTKLTIRVLGARKLQTLFNGTPAGPDAHEVDLRVGLPDETFGSRPVHVSRGPHLTNLKRGATATRRTHHLGDGNNGKLEAAWRGSPLKERRRIMRVVRLRTMGAREDLEGPAESGLREQAPSRPGRERERPTTRYRTHRDGRCSTLQKKSGTL